MLKKIYYLTLSFRNIYKNATKIQTVIQFNEWKKKVITMNIEEFNTVVNSIEYHFDNILNYFDNRSTNAYAESFNSKINVRFLLFRLEKLFD